LRIFGCRRGVTLTHRETLVGFVRGTGALRGWLCAVALGLPAAVRAEPGPCCFSSEADGIPVVHLDAAAIDSIGSAISADNVELVRRIDAAYRTGHYGPTGDDNSRKNALAAFVYNSETAFDFFLRIAMQEDVIYSTSEADLRKAFTHEFRNPGLYPIVNLRDARAGFGRFCMLFEVDDGQKREIQVAGDKMKAWTETIDIDQKPTRVVNIDMKTLSHDRVHVVYEKHSCGAVRTFEERADGQAVRIVTMEEIEGQYVRKWGFHRPQAVVLWRSVPEALEPPPAERRYLGSAIYFPHLSLELPWFLPDLGFEDLRRFDYPEPLLRRQAFEELRDASLEWLEIKDEQRFASWTGEGDVPAFVSARFPDQ
jgi:hypothetical protein